MTILRQHEPTDPEQHCRQLLARLELVSHVTASNPNSGGRSTDEAIGGKRPAGGINPRDDTNPNSQLRSHEHYRHRLQRCHTTGQHEQLARDIKKTLDAWTHTPKPPRDSVPWQQQIATASGKCADVAEEWNVTKDYVYMCRRKYGLGRKAA